MKKLLLTIALSLSSLTYAQNSVGAWGLFDLNNSKYAAGYNTEDIRSIASITKLFTAVTVIRAGLELDDRVKVQGKSAGRFGRGQMVARRDLMKAMLISSDNLAAETLAHTYPGGIEQFLTDTNQWVRGWGMTNTNIVDASGLLAGNQSTVNDLTLFMIKIKDNELLRTLSSEAKSSVKVTKGKKTIIIPLNNTNPLLLQYDNILISKTGTTNAAGKCVVMLVENDQQLFAVTVLGQRNSQERNRVAEYLIHLLPISRALAGNEYSKGF